MKKLFVIIANGIYYNIVLCSVGVTKLLVT